MRLANKVQNSREAIVDLINVLPADRKMQRSDERIFAGLWDVDQRRQYCVFQ
jgi:hypothetical protein